MQNRKALYLKHEKFCPTKRAHLLAQIGEVGKMEGGPKALPC